MKVPPHAAGPRQPLEVPLVLHLTQLRMGG